VKEEGINENGTLLTHTYLRLSLGPTTDFFPNKPEKIKIGSQREPISHMIRKCYEKKGQMEEKGNTIKGKS
jgi:hypothetical protein